MWRGRSPARGGWRGRVRASALGPVLAGEAEHLAAHIRRLGHHVAVWSRLDETLHGPNEYCLIPNLLGDAKVMAHLFLHACEE